MVVKTGHYNIGHICKSQPCENILSVKTALRWLRAKGEITISSFTISERWLTKCVNALLFLGILLGKIPPSSLLSILPVQLFSHLRSPKCQIVFGGFGTLISNLADKSPQVSLCNSQVKIPPQKKDFSENPNRIIDQVFISRYLPVADVHHRQSEKLLDCQTMKDVLLIFQQPPILNTRDVPYHTLPYR